MVVDLVAVASVYGAGVADVDMIAWLVVVDKVVVDFILSLFLLYQSSTFQYKFIDSVCFVF